jgi:hypothetical protein
VYVNHEHRIGFLAHPRTGSRATRSALIKFAGFTKGSRPHHDPALPEHEGYQKITTVRNHWDAMASWWFDAVGQSPEAVAKGMTADWFRSWLKSYRNYHRPPRLWWWLDVYPGIRIMRFETLLEDYHKLLGDLGFGLTAIAKEGYGVRRKGTPYQDVIGEEVAKLIHGTWYDEIEELGYTFS